MSDNLKIYEAVKAVPASAVKPITGGRLKGMSDLNPMWRIKTLTEQFGPCGIGWRYVITDKQLHGGGGDEVAAFLDINLYVKVGDTWSEAIPGTGGSSFVAAEKNGLYTNDECFKMALTDAISVACKALGVGADVYWDKDRTKYNGTPTTTPPPAEDIPTGEAPPAESHAASKPAKPASEPQRKRTWALAKQHKLAEGDVITKIQSTFDKDWDAIFEAIETEGKPVSLDTVFEYLTIPEATKLMNIIEGKAA